MVHVRPAYRQDVNSYCTSRTHNSLGVVFHGWSISVPDSWYFNPATRSQITADGFVLCRMQQGSAVNCHITGIFSLRPSNLLRSRTRDDDCCLRYACAILEQPDRPSKKEALSLSQSTSASCKEAPSAGKGLHLRCADGRAYTLSART